MMKPAVKISRQEGLALLLGLLVLLLMLILLWNQVGSLQAARADASRESQSLNQKELRLKQLQGIAANQELTGAQQAALEKMLPQEPDEDQLIDYLQDQADQAPARLVKLQFDARAGKKGYVEMPVLITTEQHFAGLCDLLNGLQSGGRALRIDKLKISQVQVRDMGTGAAPADLGLIRAEITAAAFARQPRVSSKIKEGNLHPERDPFQTLVVPAETLPPEAEAAGGPAASGQPGAVGLDGSNSPAGLTGQNPRLLSVYRLGEVSRAGIEIGGKYYDVAAGQEVGDYRVQEIDVSGRRVTLAHNGQLLVLSAP